MSERDVREEQEQGEGEAGCGCGLELGLRLGKLSELIYQATRRGPGGSNWLRVGLPSDPEEAAQVLERWTAALGGLPDRFEEDGDCRVAVWEAKPTTGPGCPEGVARG